MKIALQSVMLIFMLVISVGIVVLCAVAGLPDPGAALWLFVVGPVSSIRYFGNVIEATTPVLFTGLAATLMFRAGMFNIGVEGAFFLGGFVTTAAVLVLGVGAPLALLAGALVGSMVCAIPGYLRVKTGASELVTSLMFNYIALFIGLYFLNYYLRDSGAASMASYKIPADAKLPRIISDTRIHIGLLIGLLLCLVGGLGMFFTRGGFRLRATGANPRFAAHLGVNTAGILLRVQLLGGFIAALGGGIEVLGLYHRFSWGTLPGQGWTGITVAILARANPALVVPAALFMAYLQVGGELLSRNYDVPSEMVGIIQALVILCVSADYLVRNPMWVSWLSQIFKKGSRNA